MLASTFPLEVDSKVIHVCPSLAKSSKAFIAHALLHEARHIDGFDHVICNQGSMKGTDSCDQNYQQRGSYGIGTEFLLNLATVRSLSYEQRLDAHMRAMNQLLERFNTPPFDLRNGVVLATENGELYFLDSHSKKLEKIPLQIDTDDVITIRMGQITILNRRNRTVQSYVFAPSLANTPGSFSDFFRTGELPEQSVRLKNASFGSDYSCIAFQTSVQRRSGAEVTQTLSFPQGLSRFFSGAGLKSLPDNRNYITDLTGQIYTVPTKAESNGAKPYRIENYPLQVVALVPWNKSQDLALLVDGSLALVGPEKDSKKTWKVSRLNEGNQKQRFTQISGQVFWSWNALNKIGINAR